MALIKEKSTEFGLLASYWKIDMITIDRRMKEVSFCINLYMNKDAKNFIETYVVSQLMGKQDKTLFNQYFGEDINNFTDIYNACYEYTKDNEEFFKDAISDNE